MISYARFLGYLAASEYEPELLNKSGLTTIDDDFTAEWDSRSCSTESFFVALPGSKANGHKFINDAYKRGCRAFLVQNDAVVENRKYFEALSQSAICIVVNDVRNALLLAAKKHRESLRAIRIGITGSVGKTSLKEWLVVIAEMQYRVVATRGNLNTLVAIAVSIFTVSEDVDIFICELGIDRVGEMQNLVDLVLPHIAIITTIGSAHLGNYASQEELAREKVGILSRLIDTSSELPAAKLQISNPIAWVPDQHEYTPLFTRCAQGLPIRVHPDPEAWQTVKGDGHSEKTRYRSVVGEASYSVELSSSVALYPLNIAVHVASALKISSDAIQRGLDQGIELTGRGNTLVIPKGVAINDTYNASFESVMRALLDLVKRSFHKHRVAILAPMNELGEHAYRYHTRVLQYLNVSPINDVILVGRQWHIYAAHFGHFVVVDSINAALSVYASIPQMNQIVLFKGSRSYALERMICALVCSSKRNTNKTDGSRPGSEVTCAADDTPYEQVSNDSFVKTCGGVTVPGKRRNEGFHFDLCRGEVYDS